MSSSSSADRKAARAKYDFAGQVAIVTGASNGIGAEIAQHLRASGASVVNWDLQPAAIGPAADLFCQVDVTQPATIAAALTAELGSARQVVMLEAGDYRLQQAIQAACLAAGVTRWRKLS